MNFQLLSVKNIKVHSKSIPYSVIMHTPNLLRQIKNVTACLKNTSKKNIKDSVQRNFVLAVFKLP